MFHLFSQHLPGKKSANKLPDIPPEFLVTSFIKKKELGCMGISKDEVDECNDKYDIPGSDAFVGGSTDSDSWSKRPRERSGTQSTSGFGSHVHKQTRIVHFCTLCI
jgi:hypothetical protein